jgi:hypothetical protein
MEARPLAVGEIVQISPEASGGTERFGGCLMVVTEPKSWGAQGYVKNAGRAGLFFLNARWSDMEPTGGMVVWADRDRSDDDDDDAGWPI